MRPKKKPFRNNGEEKLQGGRRPREELLPDIFGQGEDVLQVNSGEKWLLKTLELT